MTLPTLKLPLHPFKGCDPETYIDNLFAKNMYTAAEAFMSTAANNSEGKGFWLKVSCLHLLISFY